MPSFNKVILMGNLTRDPQLKYTPGGTAVCKIGLAMNHTWYDKQTQQKKEEVTFVDVSFWGKDAENADKYLSKGKPVHIEGRLKLDQWEFQGEKKSRLTVTAEKMTFVDNGQSNGPSHQFTPQTPATQPEKSQGTLPNMPTSEVDTFYDDDVPF